MAWIRMCGSPKRILEYLSTLNTLVLTQPSNTAAAPATQRTWSKNSYVLGLAGANSYNPAYITQHSFPADNRLRFTASQTSWGVGFVLNSNIEKEHTYHVDFTNIESTATMCAIFYDASGTHINYLSNVTTFTVPSNAEYVIIMFQATANNTPTTIQLNDITEM